MIENKNIVVWFSCGAASAVAAKLTIEKYGATNNVMLVNNPIKEEDDDNIRFKKDVSRWLGKDIIESKNIKYPNNSIVEVFDKENLMSTIHYAPCSYKLKKEARYQFEKEIKIDYHVLGFTAEERDRHIRFTTRERPNVLPVLIDAGFTKHDCWNTLINRGIKLPRTYLIGIPNANCVGCVRSSSPTYWNLIRKHYSDVFKERCEQSRRLGCKLVELHGERIYLDELKSTDKGGKLKSFECGIFCDTY